jgi:hypothetical protein
VNAAAGIDLAEDGVDRVAYRLAEAGMLPRYGQDRADADAPVDDRRVVLETDHLEVSDQVRHVLVGHDVLRHRRFEVVAGGVDAAPDSVDKRGFVEQVVGAFQVPVPVRIGQRVPVDGRADDSNAATVLAVTLDAGENRCTGRCLGAADGRPDYPVTFRLPLGVDELAAGLCLG